jgi:hypothetical protein
MPGVSPAGTRVQGSAASTCESAVDGPASDVGYGLGRPARPWCRILYDTSTPAVITLPRQALSPT